MVIISETEGFDGCSFLVTGGAGYIGTKICCELAHRGAAEVRCYDLQFPNDSKLSSFPAINFIIGDVLDTVAIAAACNGVSCVFHLAAYGSIGKQMLQSKRVAEVNVTGTKNVLEGCLNGGVQRLVYASSCNVVFGGQEIEGGDEAMDYLHLMDYTDCYIRSKSVAERLVLEHDGHPLHASPGCLHACAVRSATVYGPGEPCRFPRLMHHSCTWSDSHLLSIGQEDARVDWVHADNAVHALMLAAAALQCQLVPQAVLGVGKVQKGQACGKLDIDKTDRKPVAAGRAYNITDGAPVNNFDFLQPIIESQGRTVRRRQVSVSCMLQVARWVEWFYCMIAGLWIDIRWLPEPPILPAEVQQAGINHWYSIERARMELGYEPIVSPREGMRQMQVYWRHVNFCHPDRPGAAAWLLVPSGMILLLLCAYVPSPFLGPLEVVRHLGLLLFSTRKVLASVWWVALAIHLTEAGIAWKIATWTDADPGLAREWALQTALLGFWSLRLLLRRVAEQEGVRSCWWRTL